MKILSIDAWGNEEDGYEWNAWYTVGEISKEEFETLDSDQKIADWFYDNEFTTTNDLSLIEIEDDCHNIVLKDSKTLEPIFALEYGPEYN